MKVPNVDNTRHPCRFIFEPEETLTDDQKEHRNEKMRQYREAYRERYRRRVELAQQGTGEWPS